MILRLFSLLGFFLLPFLSCSTSKHHSKDATQVYTSEVRLDSDQVLITLLDLREEEAFLRNVRLVPGRFKPASEQLRQREVLRVQYLNNHREVLMEKLLDNPLVQYKEYVNESGQLKYVRVVESKASVLLRSQFSREMAFIRIDYGKEKEFRKIVEIPLVLEQ